jgi:hypothetical protein
VIIAFELDSVAELSQALARGSRSDVGTQGTVIVEDER